MRVRRVARFAPAVVLMAVLWALSARPVAVEMPVGGDKIVHAIVYAVLGALLRWGAGRTTRVRWTAAACWAVAAVYGVVDEIHQASVAGRVASVGDATADAIGAAAGVWVAQRAFERRTEDGC